ncbi:MAG: hypothetical protein M9962_09970 [Oligoflexia bacterium]|nr:hypothetical protein [Oligoflexia bacterium]
MFALPLLLSAIFGLSSAYANGVSSKVEECRAKASYKYNFDMMQIEGLEINRKISHDEANKRKLDRHEDYADEFSDCDD